MAENICLMVTYSDVPNTFLRAVEVALTAVLRYKRTVLYLDQTWGSYVMTKGPLEKSKDRLLRECAANIRSFLSAGGQIWVSSSQIGLVTPEQQSLVRFDPLGSLIEGAVYVDDQMLLTFLNQDTIVVPF